MALKIVLLALLVCSAASEAQSQGDDTSLPLSYNVTELQGAGATCPIDQLRQETRDNITNGIRSQLQNSVYSSVLIAQGFSRIAYLDMTDPNQQCPSNWTEISTFGVRSCARTNSAGASCDSAFNPNTDGNSYSQVCGRVIGYQYCTTDGFGGFIENDIETFYVDGVSITHGSPRQHVWSFESHGGGCSCNGSPDIPAFVGTNYFCDRGVELFPSCAGLQLSTDLLIADPLWDGACDSDAGCCEINNPPWFCKTLPQPTTDDIEVRICADQPLIDEEVTVELIEIFVN